ncbi:MAG: periplasmic heavy metal sensor [Maricaulis sp.]|nr:periplasmic heavy metal sensor [Maricaulis sp.]MDG2045299.1 periplasmic heavy metal sensor [Maricaulis sp.]
MKQPTPWIIALLVSVLLNGALIGFMWHRSADRPSWVASTGQIGGQETRRENRRRGGFNVRAFVQALPEQARAHARQRMRANMPQARELMQQARQSRLDAEAIMSRTPFDPDAAGAAMDEMHASRRLAEGFVEGLVLELVADLEPEQREQALAAGRQGRGGPLRGRRRGPTPAERGDN